MLNFLLLFKIGKQLNKTPEYSIKICYNKTGEIYRGNQPIDIFNDLKECLTLLKSKSK